MAHLGIKKIKFRLQNFIHGLHQRILGAEPGLLWPSDCDARLVRSMASTHYSGTYTDMQHFRLGQLSIFFLHRGNGQFVFESIYHCPGGLRLSRSLSTEPAPQIPRWLCRMWWLLFSYGSANIQID